ncbi:hypothetical protein CCP3SC1_490006 [Gammaproteobacteria bacterium]
MGGEGLRVPETAQERVVGVINRLSSLVTIHSDVGGGIEAAEEISADPHPYIHLRPSGAGLKVECWVRPFAGTGPYLRPGEGGTIVIAEIEGKRLQARRRLSNKRHQAKAALSSCPVFEAIPTEEDWEWTIDDFTQCLELLVQLQSLGETAVVEWPEGEKLKVMGREAGAGQLRLDIRRSRDWFQASGELRISDELVVDVARLLGLLRNAKGRFVPLGGGQFLALTDDLRRRLTDLADYGEVDANGVRLHPLTAPALKEAVTGVGGLVVDSAWDEQLARLHSAEGLNPAPPSTLQAELRDYQQEGYRWLARLAHWGGWCVPGGRHGAW